MNRGTVIFLTLAVLLAHTLAIHQTPEGRYANPYESAHVSYRLGRNVVHAKTSAWNPGAPAVESYPSLAWVGAAAFAARLNISPTLFSQWVGLCSALITVVLLAQFSPNRMAGLIGPLLLAGSGTVAAAASSGTEAAFTMLLLTGAFLAFERGWAMLVVATLAVLILAAPQGLFVLAAFCLLELFTRVKDGRPRARSLRVPLVVATALVIPTLLLRERMLGTPILAEEMQVVQTDRASVALGARYLWGFLYASGFGVLLCVVPAALLRRRLSPTGVRAAILSGVWLLHCLLTGGDRLPFWNALAPVLPLVFLAVQDALTGWMDRRPTTAGPVWGLISLSLMASFLVSKVPGDLGPLPLDRFLRTWMRPGEKLAEAYDQPFGRAGLLEEIRKVNMLRALGVFLKDKVREDATILSLWPGAMGYISRKDVRDLLGRVTSVPGDAQTLGYHGSHRIDVVAAIEERPDYIVPVLGIPPDVTPREVLYSLLARFDVIGDTLERREALNRAVRAYELIAVPVPLRDDEAEVPSPRPFLLLRQKHDHLGPRIELEVEGGRFEVLVAHRGHRQVVDLYVTLRDASGRPWTMRPTGEWVMERTAAARTSLLMHATSSSLIRAAAGTLPRGIDAKSLTASLHSPGMPPSETLSGVGLPATAILQ